MDPAGDQAKAQRKLCLLPGALGSGPSSVHLDWEPSVEGEAGWFASKGHLRNQGVMVGHRTSPSG